MFDFMVKNASLPDGKVGMDVGCKNGIITAIERSISAEASAEILLSMAVIIPFLQPTSIPTLPSGREAFLTIKSNIISSYLCPLNQGVRSALGYSARLAAITKATIERTYGAAKKT